MPTMSERPVLDLAVMRKATANWLATKDERQRKSAAAAAGEYTKADDGARLAAHANRLLRRVRARAPADPDALPPVVRNEIARGGVTAASINDKLFEPIIGETRDFLAIGFFEAGLRAARAVGRVVVRPPGKPGSLGTGFLVSRRVMLTSRHVLHDEAEAAAATLQLGFDTEAGTTRREFQLRPDTFFLTDAVLDFSLVAVEGDLTAWGFLPLIAEEGKIVVGRPVNVIQHPAGRAKEIVIRENRLLNMPPALNWAAHYAADTEPGSSGSPVLNDAWEVVALHHSGVPKTNAEGKWLDIDGGLWKEDEDPARIAWEGNEGIRISRLIGAISTLPVKPSQIEMRDEVLRAEQTPPVQTPIVMPRGTPGSGRRNTIENTATTTARSTRSLQSAPAASGTSLVVPLMLQVSLGTAPVAITATAPLAPPVTFPGVEERLEIYPDLYQPVGLRRRFSGFQAPLPTLSPQVAGDAAETDEGGIELRYHHYSVIMNAARRLAFISAVNLNAEAPVQFDRSGSDRWVFDPRIAEEFQAGNEFYADNPLDRGHLTRRADAAWGRTEMEAKRGNDDTFHFTNCSPQHEVFNQSDRVTKRGLLLWGSLEDRVMDGAKEDALHVSVFNGPVFRSDDRTHRGLQVPTPVLQGDRGAAGRAAARLRLHPLAGEADREAAGRGLYA
jgi:endonuclease G